MAELPILPLRTAAILADTTHMTAEEFGAYCRILFVMWQHGGRLVDNPEELARIAGVSFKKWSSISARVLRPLTITEGFVSQHRLTDAWLKVQELRRKRAEASEARWRSKRNANAYPNGMQLKLKQVIESYNGEEEAGDGCGKDTVSYLRPPRRNA